VKALLVALLLVGCVAEEVPPPPPPGGGGGGGGGGDQDGGMGGDGGGDGGGGALVGRLCAAIDLRDPLECPIADLEGIPLTSGELAATSDEDGDFALDAPADSNVFLTVGAGDESIRESAFATENWRDDDAGLRAPVIARDDWEQLLAAISGIEPDATASIVLYIVDENGPVSGAEVVPQSGGDPPYYDGDAPDVWDQNGLTGPFGAAIILAVPVIDGTAALTVLVDAGVFNVTVPVRDDTLTTARALLDTTL
jgi:hypothetical protein